MSYDLFELTGEPAAPGSPVLVHALSGFLDAGSARRIAVEHLLATLPHRTVATYDLDGVYDYRARRPRMVFDTDHFESVDLPELVISELTDTQGTPFLLLHGAEPDVGWQRFTKSLVEIVDRFDVRLTVGVHAIPWASPHTRPVTVSTHANKPDLVVGRPAFVGAVEIPGHLGALIELDLGKAGKAGMGFAVHVPHYLTNGEHPRAALVLLEEVQRATGLTFPLGELTAAADAADAALDAQVADNPDNVAAIKALEAQYDQTNDAVQLAQSPMPSGDELAAQVEAFLRDLDDSAEERDETLGDLDEKPSDEG